jgi:hypothetical protein
MLEVGSSLRRSREAQGLTLADAERGTGVRAAYLHALEEERFDELPGGSYPRVFLRDYASFLGLDAALFLDELPTADPEIAPRPEPPPVRPLPVRGGALAALGLAAVAVLVFWLGSPGRNAQPPAARANAPAPHVAARRAPARHVVRRPVVPQVAVLHAARGDCWILARRGAAIVWSGTLQRGRTLRLGLTKRLWLRLGAPWNVDASLAGHRATLPSTGSPVNLWLSRAGLAPA